MTQQQIATSREGFEKVCDEIFSCHLVNWKTFVCFDAQALQRVWQARQPEIDALKKALRGARSSLLNAGFVGPGSHGTGDPEINNIDAALNEASHKESE